MSFNIGQKVTFRHDLYEGERYGAFRINKSTEKLRGDLVTIDEVIVLKDKNIFYKLKEIPGHCYPQEMLKAIPDFTKADLEDGMVVETKSHNECLRFMVFGERLIGPNQWDVLNNYDHELNHMYLDDLTIVKVYKSSANVLNDYFDDENLELIWERNKERKDNKFFNGEVVCVNLNDEPVFDQYTLGKIYEIKNGILVDNEGYESLVNIKSIEDLNEKSFATWMVIN